MIKRLTVVLACAFVLALAFAAYAEVQNVKVSGDISAFGISKTRFSLKDDDLKNGSAFASIARVKVDADLTDNVMTTVRLLNERYWGTESDSDSSIALDLAYVTLKEFLYSPLTMMVGRQELHFGNQMIIGDVDTNNIVDPVSNFNSASSTTNYPGDAGLSARKAFDAIRANLNYDPLVLDIIMAKVDENSLTTGDDTTLWGINAGYKLDKNTNLEGYFFAKDDSKKQYVQPVVGNGHTQRDNVYTIGGRIGNVAEKEKVDITSQAEMAYQFGNFIDDTDHQADRSAWGAEAATTIGFKQMKYVPSLTVLAAWFTGKKDPSSATEQDENYKGWDPMFENQSFGDIANQSFDQTNIRLLGVIGTMKPTNDVTLKGEYYAYWFDQMYPNQSTIPMTRTGYTGTIMEHKRWAGSEVDLTATYDYTEDVQFSLMYGLLLPGSAFSERNNCNANELIGSMKVTF